MEPGAILDELQRKARQDENLKQTLLATKKLWRNDQPIEVRLFGTPLFGLLEGDRLLGKPFLNATNCLSYRLICSIIERELYPVHATRRLHPNVQ